MDKNQKRLVAIALCIVGIIGSLMAGKDASAKRALESQASESRTAVESVMETGDKTP